MSDRSYDPTLYGYSLENVWSALKKGAIRNFYHLKPSNSGLNEVSYYEQACNDLKFLSLNHHFTDFSGKIDNFSTVSTNWHTFIETRTTDL